MRSVLILTVVLLVGCASATKQIQSGPGPAAKPDVQPDEQPKGYQQEPRTASPRTDAPASTDPSKTSIEDENRKAEDAMRTFLDAGGKVEVENHVMRIDPWVWAHFDVDEKKNIIRRFALWFKNHTKSPRLNVRSTLNEDELGGYSVWSGEWVTK